VCRSERAGGGTNEQETTIMRPEDVEKLTPEVRESMGNTMRLTPKARAQLDDDEVMARMDPRQALSMEVMRQVGGACTGWELEDYCDRLLALVGGDDATALAALRSGKVRWKRYDNKRLRTSRGR
jgi:hypothetical protein